LRRLPKTKLLKGEGHIGIKFHVDATVIANVRLPYVIHRCNKLSVDGWQTKEDAVEKQTQRPS